MGDMTSTYAHDGKNDRNQIHCHREGNSLQKEELYSQDHQESQSDDQDILSVPGSNHKKAYGRNEEENYYEEVFSNEF